jgi:hypothetical protein
MLIVNSVDIFILKGKKDETFKTIIENRNSEIKLGLDQFKFIYRNKHINLYEKFDEIADKYDKKINRLTIEANHTEKIVVKFGKQVVGITPCFFCIHYHQKKEAETLVSTSSLL